MRQKPIISWRTIDCPHCNKARRSVSVRQKLVDAYAVIFPDWEKEYQLLLIREHWEVCRFHKLLQYIFQRWEEAPKRFTVKGVEIDGYYPGARVGLVIKSDSRTRTVLDLTIMFPALEREKDWLDGYVLFRFRKPVACTFLMPVLDFVKYAPSDWVILLGELHSAIAAEAEETEEEVTENAGNEGSC